MNKRPRWRLSTVFEYSHNILELLSENCEDGMKNSNIKLLWKICNKQIYEKKKQALNA